MTIPHDKPFLQNLTNRTFVGQLGTHRATMTAYQGREGIAVAHTDVPPNQFTIRQAIVGSQDRAQVADDPLRSGR